MNIHWILSMLNFNEQHIQISTRISFLYYDFSFQSPTMLVSIEFYSHHVTLYSNLTKYIYAFLCSFSCIMTLTVLKNSVMDIVVFGEKNQFNKFSKWKLSTFSLQFEFGFMLSFFSLLVGNKFLYGQQVQP